MTEVKQTGDIHYCDENEIEKLENQTETNVNLPPYPVPLRAWREEDCRYKGDLTDYQRRIHDKLFKFWVLWGRLRTHRELEELLARREEDKDGDAYIAKNCIVDILNEWAKILADTDLITELAWLTLSKEEFAKRQEEIVLKEKERQQHLCNTKPATLLGTESVSLLGDHSCSNEE